MAICAYFLLIGLICKHVEEEEEKCGAQTKEDEECVRVKLMDIRELWPVARLVLALMLCMAIGRSVGTAAGATKCFSRAPEHQGSTTSRVPLAPDHQPGAPVHVTGRCDLAGLWDYHTSGHST